MRGQQKVHACPVGGFVLKFVKKVFCVMSLLLVGLKKGQGGRGTSEHSESQSQLAELS